MTPMEIRLICRSTVGRSNRSFAGSHRLRYALIASVAFAQKVRRLSHRVFCRAAAKNPLSSRLRTKVGLMSLLRSTCATLGLILLMMR